MADPFLGEIRMFGGNFAIAGWAFCNGQLMQISQNTALFALVGTQYGGNGQTTFALPDLRGRIPLHQGTAPHGTFTIGQTGGAETVTLNIAQMPAHSHVASGGASASQISPENGFWSTDPAANTAAYNTNGPNATMAGDAVDLAGGSQPHDNRQPYMGSNYIIALVGIFPSRN